MLEVLTVFVEELVNVKVALAHKVVFGLWHLSSVGLPALSLEWSLISGGFKKKGFPEQMWLINQIHSSHDFAAHVNTPACSLCTQLTCQSIIFQGIQCVIW